MVVAATSILPTPVVGARWNFLVRSRAWMGILIMVPFGFMAIFSQPHALEGTWGDIGMDTIGWALFVIGGAFRWWATLYIGGRKFNTVISDGPYSICRNPLYLGTFLTLLGFACYLESLTFAIGALLAATYYLAITVSAEEATLRAKFGQPFVDYCNRVPRFIPKFSLFQSPREITVDLRGMWSELIRCARWIWLPVLGEVIAQTRAESWFPHWFHLP
jgi:protein-S-isoprenylcysteine O-methyltransferase Ste14